VTPRVLLASHTYTAPINRAKLAALSEHVTLTAIIPQRWPDTLFTLAAQPEAARYALHPLPTLFAGRVLRYVFSLPALGNLLRQVRPDLVYVEAEPASLALAQFAALKRWHRFRLIGFTWENTPRRAGLPGVEAFNLARCDGVIAGNAEAERLVRAKGFRGPVCVTPQLGIDTEQFQPGDAASVRQALNVSGFVAGFIGRWVREKGLWILIEAIESASDMRLILIGGGPLRPEIERRIEERRLGARVRLVNAVPHERVPDYLRALDVLVLPSLTTAAWKEQFGHVLIEAMACGVPVIGSDSGAIPEVIGEAGLVLPEGDASALRAALQRLQADPLERQRLARLGRERVLAHYTHEKIAAANAAFFHRILAAR